MACVEVLEYRGATSPGGTGVVGCYLVWRTPHSAAVQTAPTEQAKTGRRPRQHGRRGQEHAQGETKEQPALLASFLLHIHSAYMGRIELW